MLYNADPEIITKEVKGDTIRTYDTVYLEHRIKGETDTVEVDTTIYVDVPYLDTIEMKRMVKEYMAKYISNDTLDIKYGYVYISDTVQMNKIKRNWSANFKMPRVTVYETIPEAPKVKVYFGPSITVMPKLVFGVGGILKSKTDKLYGLNIGIGGQGLSYGATYMVKL